MDARPKSSTRASPTNRSRRDVIVENAARLFAERGYAGASLRDVAAASGVRQPSIYSHFESKDSLFIAAVNPYLDDFLPRLRDAAAHPAPAVETLERMLVTSVHVGMDHRYNFLALSNNWAWIEQAPALEVLREGRDVAFELWQRTLLRGAREGTLRRVRARETFWIISSSITGMVDRRYAGSSSTEPPVTALLEILINGLAPRADSAV